MANDSTANKIKTLDDKKKVAAKLAWISQNNHYSSLSGLSELAQTGQANHTKPERKFIPHFQDFLAHSGSDAGKSLAKSQMQV
jgi:hypothetical protein